MTADEFRGLALGIDGAIESAHMSHPDFRIGGKIFASLGTPNDEWGMVKLTPERQRAFIGQASEVFKPCTGAWGRQGYTNVHLVSANKKVVKTALEEAARNVASSAKKKRPT
jgi:hypothetical protein